MVLGVAKRLLDLHALGVEPDDEGCVAVGQRGRQEPWVERRLAELSLFFASRRRLLRAGLPPLSHEHEPAGNALRDEEAEIPKVRRLDGRTLIELLLGDDLAAW